MIKLSDQRAIIRNGQPELYHPFAKGMKTGRQRTIAAGILAAHDQNDSGSQIRYGALGAMGVGEGPPELVKQLLGSAWDSSAPDVILIWLTGEPRRGVGPHDVGIALTGAVYKNGFVKNKVLEFAGPGVAKLPADYRIGIDVMTTETTCLSSIWQTDDVIKQYYTTHLRPGDYKEMKPLEGATYDGQIEIDLSTVEPMAALPFHPSEAVTLRELIPSGETSSCRSNPLRLASYTLSRREPEYVPRAKAIQRLETERSSGNYPLEVVSAVERAGASVDTLPKTRIGSALFCESPGNGSAREQAASCQRVLGASANICRSYATKRYRSNCVNWGMLPFTNSPEAAFDYAPGDWIHIPNIRQAVKTGADKIQATVITPQGTEPIMLLLPGFTQEECELVLAGCLMNWYAARNQAQEVQ